MRLQTRRCPQCRRDKSKSAFHFDKRLGWHVGYCFPCKRKKARHAYHNTSYGARALAKAKATGRQIKAEMIVAYGGKCAGLHGFACNETRPDALQIDHIFDDGYLARRAGLTYGGSAMYFKLKKMGWPKDRYQLLCASCNFCKKAAAARAKAKDVL